MSVSGTMKRLILIGLTLAAFAPSARAEPVKAPVRPPSVAVQDLAAQDLGTLQSWSITLTSACVAP